MISTVFFHKHFRKQTFFLLATVLISSQAFAQTLNIQTGVSFSKIDIGQYDESDSDGRSDNINRPLGIGFNVLIGIDYINHERYNLSSNIGYLERVGREESVYGDILFGIYNQQSAYVYNMSRTYNNKYKQQYFTINTAFDYKFLVRESIIAFISLGLHADFNINTIGSMHYEGDFSNTALTDYKKVLFGPLLGVGVKYNIERYQIGLRTDYYFNLDATNMQDKANNTIKSEGSAKIKAKTLTLNIVLGYRL